MTKYQVIAAALYWFGMMLTFGRCIGFNRLDIKQCQKIIKNGAKNVHWAYEKYLLAYSIVVIICSTVWPLVFIFAVVQKIINAIRLSKQKQFQIENYI